MQLAATAATGGPDVLLWATSTLFCEAIGFVLPGAHSWGQLTGPPSGSAPTLTGAAQFLGGLLGSPATGLLGSTTLSLGVLIAASSPLALLAWRLAIRATAGRLLSA